MREIKFRGKRVDNGEWVYGFLFELSYDGFSILCIGTKPLSANDYSEIYKSCYDEVNPSTIGQYTGLNDKNGKEIYEGDIITTDLERNYLIVEYRNGAFMLNCNDGLEDYYDIFFGTSEEPTEVYKYGEVIGNIYENPGLMI